jgi:hypothetical protein
MARIVLCILVALENTKWSRELACLEAGIGNVSSLNNLLDNSVAFDECFRGPPRQSSGA